MDGSMPPGSSEPQDITMTNAEGEAGNMFDEMLDELSREWGSQDPFMLQNEVPPECFIDPALFAESLEVPNPYGASPSASASPARQEEQAYHFTLTTSPTHLAGQVIVSTPIQQQESTAPASSDYSPSSSGLHTPTHRDRGHYGSARRRTGALTNFQTIAASPQRESVQANIGYSFESIPEHQQGILSPSNYINEDIPEFRPRRVISEPENRYDSRLTLSERLGSPCLAADPEAFEDAAGGFDSQGTEPGASQEMAQLQNALQFPSRFPVAPPAYTQGIVVSNSPPSHAPGVDANANQNSANYIPVAPQNAIRDAANAFPNYAPVAPPNTIVQANATVPTTNPNRGIPQNTITPWASGLTFEAEPDPERRAKMQEIASVSHMLLTPKGIASAAVKSKVLQAGKAADEEMRKKSKKAAKRARKNTAAQGKTNTNNTRNPAPPATINQPASVRRPASIQQLGSIHQTASVHQPGYVNQPVPVYQQASTTQSAVPSQLAHPKLPVSTSQLVPTNPVFTKPSAKARGRNIPAPFIPTYEEKVAQFWNGRLDKTGKELEASVLCHGSVAKYQPRPRIENTVSSESTLDQYSEEPNDDHPKLSEDAPNRAPAISELTLYSQAMNRENCETPVYSGQVLVVSYDMNSDWWHRVNIWAFGRKNLARYPDEIAIVITPFHVIFGRIQHTNNIEALRKEWVSVLGLVERTYLTPTVGAKGKTWAYMYRIAPYTARQQEHIDHREEQLTKQDKFFNDLGINTVYSKRFRHRIFWVPPVGYSLENYEFGIRVGRFGKEGQFDRLRVEVRDMAGSRILQD